MNRILIKDERTRAKLLSILYRGFDTAVQINSSGNWKVFITKFLDIDGTNVEDFEIDCAIDKNGISILWNDIEFCRWSRGNIVNNFFLPQHNKVLTNNYIKYLLKIHKDYIKPVPISKRLQQSKKYRWC